MGERRWRMRVDARPAQVPAVRREVVGVIARECPGVDLDVAALVVTELATNVVNHAYADGHGQLEVDLLFEPDAATLTVRDWGRGFGTSTRHGMGMGLEIVARLAQAMRVERGVRTEVRVRLSRALA